MKSPLSHSRLPALLFPVLVASCSREQTVTELDWSFARMQTQRKAKAFDETTAFPDGRVLQRPPAETVAYASAPPPREVEEGLHGDVPVDAIPIPVTTELVHRGQDRFGIFCAPCHGVTGDARSVIATKMKLRPPRSLHDDVVKGLPDGSLYRVIRDGYGLMPPYRAQLDVEERWAVVAYVRALELSRSAEVATLPADVRDELARRAP